MLRPNPIVVEGLESRTMLSAAPPTCHIKLPPPPLDPVIQADINQIATLKAQLKTDEQAWGTVLKADRQAIADAIKALDATLAPFRQKLAEDKAASQAVINTDVAAIRTVMENYKPILEADVKAIWAAKGDPTAQAAAKAQLAADRQKMNDELAPLYAQLKTDKEAAEALLKADWQAIQSVIDSDQAVLDARKKLADDEAAAKLVLQADRDALAAAQKKLCDDLKAFKPA